MRGLFVLLALALALPARAQTPPPKGLVEPPGMARRTPEELEAISEYERDIARYIEMGEEHNAEIKTVLRREYDRRLSDLNSRYEKGIAAAEKDFRDNELDAIRLLKEFLAKYPDDPKYTPDAMFRLADLLLDEAGWEYDAKQAALAKQTEPPPPDEDEDFTTPVYDGPEFSPSIDLWRDIVRRFPSYRQIDGVVYLLALYLQQMQRVPEAKQAYLGLVCRNKHDPLDPPPPVAPTPTAPLALGPAVAFVDPYEGCTPLRENKDPDAEVISVAWMKLGELHFDSRGELNLAIAAYRRVVERPESKNYDLALYKLAWTYYRNNQFIDGIKAFDELVLFSDRREDAGGEMSEIRPEAVRYIAISFADPWEGDVGAVGDPVKSIERANAFYKGRTERHVRDVYEELGDDLRITAGTTVSGEVPPETATAYRQAIVAWRHAVESWPLHPRAPMVHKKIVDALAFIGDAEAAAAERKVFAELYKKDSAWYVANQTNREAMDYAQRQGEIALLDTAKNLQREASKARKAAKNPPTDAERQAYTELYAQAATFYERYLRDFPTSAENYDVTFQLGQCRYFGERYVEAVPHFRWVREHKELGNKTDAAASLIVSAWESAVRQAIANKSLVEPPLPTIEQMAQSPQAVPLPDLYREQQAAYDEYARLYPGDDKGASRALLGALISYRHFQLDDAATRLVGIVDTFCQTSEAVNAKDSLLAIYEARGQPERFKAVNEDFINRGCGQSADRELARAQNLSTDFKLAVKLFEEALATKNLAKFEAAGEAFYALYRTSGETYENRADVLFNAALCYTNAGKPKTAIAIDQEFLSVPAFKQSKYYVEVLFRSAKNFQNAFDYDQAVDIFLQVADVAAEPKRTSRPEFSLVQARLDALYNAAVLRDLDRVYYDRGRNDPGAATLYKRYASVETDRAKASLAYFAAAQVYEKAGNTKDMIKAFGEWRKTYGKDAGAGAYLVLSQHKTAKALEKQRDRKGAEQYYKETIKAFVDAGAPRDGADYAAEAQFWLAEKVYADKFEPYKVKWLGNIMSQNQKKAEQAVLDTLAALKKVADETAANYDLVIKYETGWSLAALVRLGDINFNRGDKLLNAPTPKEILDLDKKYPDMNVLAQYQDGIAARVQPLTDAARDMWVKAVEAAKKKGISNDWSKLALSRLNANISIELYPVMRDEEIDRETNP